MGERPTDIQMGKALRVVAEFLTEIDSSTMAEVVRDVAQRLEGEISEAKVKAAAYALVPFSYDAFEDQGRYDPDLEETVDRPPAGTPRELAYKAARAALEAAAKET